jgi:AraC-like DNA-binding protein
MSTRALQGRLQDEGSNFCRAYKKWTGTTPAQYQLSHN